MSITSAPIILLNESRLSKAGLVAGYGNPGLLPLNRWEQAWDADWWTYEAIIRGKNLLEGGSPPALPTTWSIGLRVMEVHDGWTGPIFTTPKVLPFPEQNIPTDFVEGGVFSKPGVTPPVSNLSQVIADQTSLGLDGVNAISSSNPLIVRRTVHRRTLRQKLELTFTWTDPADQDISIYIAAHPGGN